MTTKTSTELHMVSCAVYGWSKSPDTQAQARMIIKRKIVITGNLWRGCESLLTGKSVPNCTIVVKHAPVIEKTDHEGDHAADHRKSSGMHAKTLRLKLCDEAINL
jgi:hypothetical protein